jgi:GT2 family glycosyltransferase
MLSVIINVHNGAEHLAEQLDSLRAQECVEEWEVIVVDNASTDATVEIARSRGMTLPHFRIVSATGKLSTPYGRNVGADSTVGDKLVYLDHDDVLAPGYLAAMSSALGKYPFVGARIDVEALNPAWAIAARGPSIQEAKLAESHSGRCGQYVVTASLGIRREVLRHVGGFDENTGAAEDSALGFRLHAAGYKGGFVPDAVLHYRYRSTFRSIYRQAQRYAMSEARLDTRYPECASDPVAPTFPITLTMRWCRALIKPLVRFVAHPGRATLGRICWVAGGASGFLAGRWAWRRERSVANPSSHRS